MATDGDASLILAMALAALFAGLFLAALFWPRDRTHRQRAAELAAELSAVQARLAERSEQLQALGEERRGLSDQLEAARRDLAARREEVARLREQQEQLELRAQEKLALLEEARERMTKEFKLLSGEILSQQGETFAKRNETQLTGLLDPLRRRLTEFQTSLETVQRESAKERAGLSQQVKSLAETGQRMSLETHNLTRALKGKTQTQGVWGEMLLATILERSGLREGEEYHTQVSHSDETGQRLRPDVIVTLPNGERIVVDAKVSLTAFEAYANAETDAERASAMADHARSLREHIRGLGGKGYQALGGDGPEFVIMFLPIEEALSAALQHSRDLVDEALKRDIVLATPTTLMIALKTVHNLWRIEGRSRNVEEIAERGGRLYDKFVGFVEDMKGLGQRMDQARSSYESAFGKLVHGRGNLVGQADKLRQLGAKTTKSLPSETLEAAETSALPNAKEGRAEDAA